MEVEATIGSSLVFAGDRVPMIVEFVPPPADSNRTTPVSLSGYAAVQGSFRLGEMILSEPFAETRKAGTVSTKRGFDYGQPQSSGGLFANVLDGLKHLVVTGSNPNASSSGSSGSSGSGVSQGRGDEGEYPIFATSQSSSFTDSKLEPNGSTHKFSFYVDSPPNSPPTYRSRSLHITYNLVVGFERLKLDANGDVMNMGPQDTRSFLPFRLSAKPTTAHFPDPSKFDSRKPYNAPPPQLAHEVNGEKGEGHVEEDMDTFVQNLLKGEIEDEDVTRHRRSSIAHIPGAQYTKVSYEINRGRTPIAQLVLARPVISVGDILAAQIRFKRPCLHLSVYLELEEIIDENYAALGGVHMQMSRQNPRTPAAAGSRTHSRTSSTADNGTAANNANAANNADTESNSSNGNSETNWGNEPSENEQEADQNEDHANTALLENGNSGRAPPRPPVATPDELVATTYTIYGRQFQGVYGMSELPIFSPTLASVTPRLDTEQICASWTLRLEFVGLAGAAFSDDDDNELSAKGQIDHETFTCRIPVVIMPPSGRGPSASKTWRF